MIYNPTKDDAFLLFGEFWGIYKCLNIGGQPMGGSLLLGAPTNEKRFTDNSIRQDFEGGWLILNGDEITVHLTTHQYSDKDVTNPCGALPKFEYPF